MNRSVKRSLIVLGGLMAVLVVTIGGLLVSAFTGNRPIPEQFEINGVRLVRDGFTTVWVVPVGPGQVALIDAGNDSSGAAIHAELSRRGLGADAVAAIFLTHGHADHLAGVTLFPDAEVMALAAEADLIAGRTAPTSPMGRLMPMSLTGIEVDRMLRDGETVRVGSAAVTAYAVRGHTDGSAAYLVNGVLVLGDAGNVTDGDVVRGPLWIFSNDVEQGQLSLQELAQRLAAEGARVDAIAFAHSGPLARGLTPLAAYSP
jgi:glyoxylase-like metal-dependent hydrolase (beta-lactamase superfamily II)